MPSALELAAVSVIGTAVLFVAFLAFDLPGPVAVLLAAAVSLNYWAIRGFWRARRERRQRR